MAMDAGLNGLLKWGIKNSDGSQTTQSTEEATRTGLTEEGLRALMGGPSDADLMKDAMAVIVNPEADLEARLIAFDNFEQLIEGIDNANNMEPLGLWTPLVRQLDDDNAEVRKLAAWCCGTAVQNNLKAQERLLVVNGIPRLCDIAVNDKDAATRKKGVYALSSAVRNYQPALNEAIKHLPEAIVGQHKVSASDMDAIDVIMTTLRERST